MTTTHEPLELLGVQPGLTFVDPATVLTRLWYFDGKFLRAEGFRRDQQYVRSLVALSNQANGHGVVHGFDVRRGTGDRITVDGGLAIAPSGKVVHLPSGVPLSVTELIERSFGDLAPDPAGHGSAEFGRCPPEAADDDVTVVPPRPVYVLTVASAEALCGEEERFGQLCEGACATETDRELVVEGVRFRLHELDLQLPVSTRVPFDERHLRSQVATAYFAREARSPGSAISGAGLRSGVWCDGADAVAGEEVPLAVLGRSGSGGVWLDMWTARRELIETNPHRYWAGRLAMRPWPVFGAHLLQFQCQLTDAPVDGGGDGGGPCADERAALAETDRVLTTLLSARARIPAAADRLDRLRLQIADVLSGNLASPSGSLFVDRGLVTVPSGGYVPVRPDRPVEEQVRALFGPGVDLRFCAVRADFVPEALQEAQHMERISLTRGIDDPSDIEEVDVLVPGGRFADVRPVGGFTGVARILPALRRQVDQPDEEGSALSLSAVARDQVQQGWSWSAAAFGEAPHRLAVGHLANLAGYAVRDGDEEPPPAEVYIEHDEVHDDFRDKAAFRQRLLREGVLARERLDRAVRGGFTEIDDDVAADRPLPRDEKRPVALWVDVETADDLREVAVGAQTNSRLRFTAYSRAAVEPLLYDARITGGLVVTSRQTAPVGGNQVMDIRTELSGVADVYVLFQGQEEDPPPRSVRGIKLRWRVAVGAAGPRILAVELEPPQARFRMLGQETGMPRHVSVVVTGPSPRSRVDVGEWEAKRAAAAATDVQLATLELDESEHALDPGSPGRDIAEAVIDVLGAELAVRGVDASFAAPARQRMFETAGGGRTLTSTTDWVMFHRRRTKDCGDAGRPPVATRKFRWYHAQIGDTDSLNRFADLAGRYVKMSRASGDLDALRVRPRLDGLGFEPVTVVEFAQGAADLVTPAVQVRNAWSATRRSTHLLRGVVASPSTGDGTQIDLARLTATTSVVSDLVDTTALQTSAVAEIPPEFQETGLDGVFFTIGVDRPTRSLRMMVAKVTDLTSWLDQGDGDDITVERLRETFGDNLDTNVADWDDTTLVNQAEIESWWGGSAVKASRFVVASSIDTTARRNYAEEASALLTRILGGGDRPRSLAPSPYVDAGDDTEVLLILLASG